MTQVAQRAVIVGAGLAGAKAAEALRDKGFPGTVTLVGSEPLPPYERPPLSKSYLQGESGFDDALVHPQAWYAEHDVELRTGAQVTAVHRTEREVELADGQRLGYDHLVLATGSTPRSLPIPGVDAAGVRYLRTRPDSDALRASFGSGRRLVIIGGGWIGLEVAAAARTAGTEVTLIEMAELPLLAVLGSELAQVFAGLHRDHGVELRLATTPTEITTSAGTATGVRLDGGETIAADTVLIGVGAAPNVELAEAAGLSVDNGVLVDAALRSSDPAVYAIGDIANQLHPTLGVRVRVEHWANALNQPGTVADAILGKPDAAYTNLPYFYTDQYDLGMEYVGHAPPGSYAQVVVRGELATREFVSFWLDEGNRIKAAMNVNVWDVVDAVKPLIAAGVVVDPQRLADPGVPYSELT